MNALLCTNSSLCRHFRGKGKTSFGVLFQVMNGFCEKLTSYQFLTAFPQLTSRICHSQEGVFNVLKVILVRQFNR